MGLKKIYHTIQPQHESIPHVLLRRRVYLDPLNPERYPYTIEFEGRIIEIAFQDAQLRTSLYNSLPSTHYKFGDITSLQLVGTKGKSIIPDGFSSLHIPHAKSLVFSGILPDFRKLHLQVKHCPLLETLCLNLTKCEDLHYDTDFSHLFNFSVGWRFIQHLSILTTVSTPFRDQYHLATLPLLYLPDIVRFQATCPFLMDDSIKAAVSHSAILTFPQGAPSGFSSKLKDMILDVPMGRNAAPFLVCFQRAFMNKLKWRDFIALRLRYHQHDDGGQTTATDSLKNSGISLSFSVSREHLQTGQRMFPLGNRKTLVPIELRIVKESVHLQTASYVSRKSTGNDRVQKLLEASRKPFFDPRSPSKAMRGVWNLMTQSPDWFLLGVNFFHFPAFYIRVDEWPSEPLLLPDHDQHSSLKDKWRVPLAMVNFNKSLDIEARQKSDLKPILHTFHGLFSWLTVHDISVFELCKCIKGINIPALSLIGPTFEMDSAMEESGQKLALESFAIHGHWMDCQSFKFCSFLPSTLKHLHIGFYEMVKSTNIGNESSPDFGDRDIRLIQCLSRMFANSDLELLETLDLGAIKICFYLTWEEEVETVVRSLAWFGSFLLQSPRLQQVSFPACWLPSPAVHNDDEVVLTRVRQWEREFQRFCIALLSVPSLEKIGINNVKRSRLGRHADVTAEYLHELVRPFLARDLKVEIIASSLDFWPPEYPAWLVELREHFQGMANVTIRDGRKEIQPHMFFGPER